MPIARRSDRLSSAITAAAIGLAVSLATLAGPPSTHAAAVLFGVDASLTATTLFDTGDRRLDAIAFLDSTTTWTGANFLTFAAGSITALKSGQGIQPAVDWAAPAPRDLTPTSNVHSINPDRADLSTPFLTEAAHTATLAEVFTAFTHDPAVAPYKNLSYILDGEVVDHHDTQFLSLLFAPGQVLSADADPNSIELAWLERGGNSDVLVQGILDFVGGAPVLTAPLTIHRTDTAPAGWSLNTLETATSQPVVGVGISLDPAWKNLIGFQFSSFDGANGPDTVAVGTAFTHPSNLTPIPEPASASIVLLGVLVGAMRRARK